MEKGTTVCPVCTLYLREGITLQAHLDTHPKDKVIEALLKITVNGSSGQKVQPQSTSVGAVTAAGDTLVPTQTYAAPSTAFMSQTHQNYMNPQTQMTAAVTYQQFVTSNGSVMPQYIQVPTIVCPNGNVPMVPNQTVNYVPNQQAAFANTMYNPLYNPYIPQPYPFVQPMYGNMPSTTESNTQVTTSQGTNAVTPSSSQSPLTIEPSSVLKEVSSVATNTIFPKTVTGKPKTKKGPLKTMTRTKFKIVKQSGSRVKTTTSTVATVATKSFKITSVNGKTNSTAKTAVITKAKSIKTKYRPLLPKPTASSSVPPPPLMLMPRTQGSLECTEPPPPPPLSKAPCASPVSFEITVKSEKRNIESERPVVKPEILEGECDDIRDNKDFILEHDEVPPVNSVIVESNSAIQITSNFLIGASITSEDESSPGFDGKKLLPEVSTIENESVQEERISESDGCEIVSVETEQSREEQDKRSDCDVEDQPLSENVFQAFDFQEEKKITFNFEVNRNIAKESESANVSRDEDENLNEEEYEVPDNANDQEPKNKTSETEESIGASESEVTAIPSNRKTSNCMPLWNANMLNTANNEKSVDLGETRSVPDLKSVTYTDLQPASSSKVLQELGITTSFDMNNFMEVDGIKIFFNNASVQNMPLEPIIKFSSTVKNDVTKIANYRKPENDVRENNAMVESVIHIVSGPAPKNDVSIETFQNSNSDSQMDLSDLSPLALNIRADESMPARGELSEQESLGAENSNWGLFHSDADAMKPRQSTKEVDPLLITVDQQEMEKKFKCPYCPEMFSCMKARRMHKINVHEKSRSSAPKKPRTFACAQCKEKFNSLRDRRRHVIQTHYFDARKVNQIKEESEVREENTVRDETIVVSGLPIKLEDNVSVKYETSVDAEGNKTFEATKICTECGLKVTGSKKLKEHLREVHGVSRYKCGTCSETFDTDRDYNSHLRIHPLECNECGKMFSRKPNLKLHLRRHLVIKPYVCNQCPKSFVTRQKLEEHVNGHSGNKPLKCSLCDSTFSRYSNLIQHRNMRHLSGKKKVKDFVCRCGEVFHSLRKLEWHKEVHETKPKTCPFCSQKFIHSNSVTRHIRRSHIPNYLPNDKKDIENVQCPVCGKVYLRSSLIVHMRVHNGEKPFVCKICNKSFTTKWNLALHNWTHQSRNNMPYKCTICKSAFFREVDYVAHLNSHKNHRPFTCNVCGQKFIRKYNCLRHQDEHKKEKKFVCTVNGCGKSFHRSYYLRDHMKVHTGVRPHTCHICGKASSTKSNHNKHVRIHDTREPLNTEN